MGLISDFFIADDALASLYARGEGYAGDDYYRFSDISPLQASQLLAVLRGVEVSPEHIAEFHRVTDEGERAQVLCIPHDMLFRLSKLEENDIESVASRFVAVSHAELGWEDADCVPLLRELVTLADRALENGKSMYLLNSV